MTEPSKTPQPPFTMSKYASELDLLRAKCAWQEGQMARLGDAISDTQSKLDEAAKHNGFQTCAYCGHTDVGEGGYERVSQHVVNCENHPLRVKLREVEAYAEETRKLLRAARSEIRPIVGETMALCLAIDKAIGPPACDCASPNGTLHDVGCSAYYPESILEIGHLQSTTERSASAQFDRESGSVRTPGVATRVMHEGSADFQSTPHGSEGNASPLHPNPVHAVVPGFDREAFEEKVFADYFIRGIRRNPSVPKPRIAGCLDFVPAEDMQDKATFCERDGEGYKREDVSAMWHGWKLAAKGLHSQVPKQEPTK